MSSRVGWLLVVSSSLWGIACGGKSDELGALFRERVLNRIGNKQAKRGVHQLSMNFADGCEPLMARCMSSLTMAPSTWIPDPAELRAESDKCSLEVCNCAGSPAIYDAATGVCESTNDRNIMFEDNSQLTDRPNVSKYTQASCDQIERCSNRPCDIRAWVKYTKGLSSCDTMWHCVKKQVSQQVDSCDDKVTVDRDNNTCDQRTVCDSIRATYQEIPDGIVDCEWEYQKALTDPVISSKINEKCSSEACSCIRRGDVTSSCGSSTMPTCCVGGNPWDSVEVGASRLSYSHLTCEEIDLCVSASTYCKKISGPELFIPPECKGKPLEYQQKSSNCYAGESNDVLSAVEGTTCNSDASVCGRIKAASTAKCNIIPLLHQSCDQQSELAEDGHCRCKDVSNHETSCVKGSCVSIPISSVICTKEDNCTNHAVSATFIENKCVCSCQPNWYGDFCEVVNTEVQDDQLPKETIIGVAVGCAFLCLLMTAAVCYLTKTPASGSGADEPKQLSSKLLQQNSDEKPQCSIIQIDPPSSVGLPSQPPSQRVTPTNKDAPVVKKPSKEEPSKTAEPDNIEMAHFPDDEMMPGFDKPMQRDNINSMIGRRLSSRRRSSGTLPTISSAPSSRRSSRRSSIVDSKKPPRRRSSSGKKRTASGEYSLDLELRDLVPPKASKDGTKTPTRRIRDSDLSAALVSLEKEFKSGSKPTSSMKPPRRERANTAMLPPTDFLMRSARTPPRSQRASFNMSVDQMEALSRHI
eukprot:TRINITY_DN4460_c0_g1_i1.p1 TRINITY_DN4460_c0_g1~~TRINITY_DN4460_c0_g1_i1.p1  ORF type:complete len:768 (+),score=141.05 TRINITY_DN4460_c0_g1_i1:54-2306(+)